MAPVGNTAKKRERRPRLNLSGAHVPRTNFSNTDLTLANLSNADCRHVDFTGANMDRASLKGADLRGAILRDVDNLTWEQLSEATIDETTVLPDYLQKGREST